MSLHHFSFGAPAFLVLLVLVPLFFAFVAWIRRRRSRYSVAFTNLATLRAVSRTRGTHWARQLPLVLIALALVCMVAALARPNVRLSSSERGATIVLLADVSDSMQATDIRPSRLFASVKAMHDLVDALPSSDRIGLVTFSDKVEILNPPTYDHIAIHSSLDVLSPEGGTALSAGVQAAVKLIVSTLSATGVEHRPGEYLPAAIVLESDGAQDRGSLTPGAAAALAKEAGIRIYGVAVGTRHGYVTQGSGLLTRSVRVLPSPGTVELLARETGGRAYSATNASQLVKIYRSLGSNIGQRENRTEITGWFELVAALLLVAGVGLTRARGAALP